MQFRIIIVITCRAYMDHSYLTQPQGRKQREVQSPYAAKMSLNFLRMASPIWTVIQYLMPITK